MTLVEARKSSKLIGRCDARCYNATSSKCNCICGGANHGIGFIKARTNMTDKLQGEIVQKLRERPDFQNDSFYKDASIKFYAHQLELHFSSDCNDRDEMVVEHR